MDRNWTPLSPTKRHSLLPTTASIDSIATNKGSYNQLPAPKPTALDPFAIGDLPSSVVQHIFQHVHVNDLAKCALAARPLARFVADERLWARRLKALDWKPVEGLEVSYDPDLSTVPKDKPAPPVSAPDRKQSTASNDDDFGDFETADFDDGHGVDDDSFGGFASAESGFDRSGQTFSNAPVFSYRAEFSLPMPSSDRNSAYQTFKRIAIALKPLLKSLATEATPTSSLVFSHPNLSSLASQAAVLSNIARFTGPTVLAYLPPPLQGATAEDGASEEHRIRFGREAALRKLQGNVREAADYLEGVLLSAFEGAEARRSDAVRAGERGMEVQKSVERSEEAMREHAGLIWLLAQSTKDVATSDTHAIGGLRDATSSYLDPAGSSAALSFLEKRDILFRKLPHNPDSNIIASGGSASLDFTAMDSFMKELLTSVKEDGSLIARVFPEDQDVLLAFASRVANEVMADYINAVLRKARALSVHLYLQACAATFSQALRLVDTLTSIEPKRSRVSRQRCEPIVFEMWDVHMDEYLQEERDWVKEAMSQTCEESGSGDNASTNMDAAFLNSHNPAAVKRNVLTGFKDVLLMPVTVVPRAAGVVGGAVIRTAGSGLSQLNPLRWQSSSTPTKSGTGASTPLGPTPTSAAAKGYVDFSNGGTAFALDDDEDDDEFGAMDEKTSRLSLDGNEWSSEIGAWGGTTTASSTKTHSNITPALTARSTATTASHATASEKAELEPPNGANKPSRFSRLQLLLSLDTALQLIQLNRESLKRMEAFLKLTGTHGARVKEEIKEISVLFFQTLGEKHVAPGFEKASAQIRSWKPSEQGSKKPASAAKEAGSTVPDVEAQVAPLVHFFELVHVGDTIQQMVQVYYDQELSRHIDRTDFLNGVVREKKRFEGALDESVASGLNVGVDLLMGQAEWLITTHQDPRDYYPEPGRDLDLANPTRACRECVECLKVHCRMLVGSTDKTVLEVFYQEVGMRLHAIICKHLKRQIISLDGGFKVIADLNAYQAFIASLRQPTVTLYFDALKMLGNLYIIDNPKELASIVRDANMFNGTLSPEDLYEFLQARCDFKSIEKAIDKEIYGFKATEDCCIM